MQPVWSHDVQFGYKSVQFEHEPPLMTYPVIQVLHSIIESQVVHYTPNWYPQSTQVPSFKNDPISHDKHAVFEQVRQKSE